MATKLRPLPAKTYTVKMAGDYEGIELVMSGMTTRDLIRMRGGELSDVDALEMVASHVISSNLDGDILDADSGFGIAVLGAWADAIRDAALPPTPAAS